MCSGDFLGDFGQGGIVFPGIFEPVFGDHDGVRAAAPFPDKTVPGLRLRLGVGPTRPVVGEAFAMV